VVAYDNDNKVVAEQVICTAGQTYTLKLTADRNKIKPDGKDLSFVTVEVLDKKGNLCPKADNLLFLM
jgi:beta-galactosidase